MPNWTTTKIKVRGSVADLARFVRERIKKEESSRGEMVDILDFNEIIPEPATPEECPAKYVMKDEADAKKRCLGWDEKDPRRWFDWYNWHIDNWNTKWGACNTQAPSAEEIEKEQLTEIAIWTETAWSPATPVYRKLQKMYPELGIEVLYGDEGGFYVGRLQENGTDLQYPGCFDSPEPKEICDEIGMEYLYMHDDDEEEEDM